MPTKFVRVRLENGTEKTVTETFAKIYGHKPLNKPTHGRDGQIKPPKHRVPLGGAASATKTDAARVSSDTSAPSGSVSKEK
jgi:hypothetical protein